MLRHENNFPAASSLSHSSLYQPLNRNCSQNPACQRPHCRPNDQPECADDPGTPSSSSQRGVVVGVGVRVIGHPRRIVSIVRQSCQRGAIRDNFTTIRATSAQRPSHSICAGRNRPFVPPARRNQPPVSG